MGQNAEILIVTLDRIDGQAIVVGFSDGTVATYAVRELLGLRPDRAPGSEEPSPDDPGSA